MIGLILLWGLVVVQGQVEMFRSAGVPPGMFISFNSLPNQPPQFASQPPQFAAQPPQFAALTPPNPSPAPPDLLDQIFDKPVAPTPGGVVAAAGGPSTVQSVLTNVEIVRQTLLMLGNPTPGCSSDGCDINKWPKCTCVSPAIYDNEGRGNCNLGATKVDNKVWCYLDPRAGDARMLCPDAQLSTSKTGFFWSRFACIT